MAIELWLDFRTNGYAAKGLTKAEVLSAIAATVTDKTSAMRVMFEGEVSVETLDPVLRPVLYPSIRP